MPSRTKKSVKHPSPRHQYPGGFVYGQGEANPWELSLSGLKAKRALRALTGLQGEVLELGCGGGQYLRALRHYAPQLRLQGVDLDPRAVESSSRIPGAQCRRADVAHLPFAASQFNAVMGFDILEHVGNPDKVLAESFRVLKPGGLLHCYVPCEGNPGTIYVKRGHEVKARWGGHVRQFSSQDLLERIARAGFTVAHVRYSDYWLTQQFDYAFFNRLEKSADPAALWAAQALKPGGGPGAWVLRLARRLLSAVSWLENTLRWGPRGAMGMHVTARKPKKIKQKIENRK